LCFTKLITWKISPLSIRFQIPGNRASTDGSKSISRVFFSAIANAAARFTAVVVPSYSAFRDCNCYFLPQIPLIWDWNVLIQKAC